MLVIMKRIKRLIKSSIDTIKIEGMNEFINKSKFYVKSRIFKDKSNVFCRRIPFKGYIGNEYFNIYLSNNVTV